jgi:hypothetical protein
VKRLIFASVVLLSLAALTIWGNRLVGHTLDAELGPLLTRQLGLPVQLAPIKAHLLQLQASSPKLVMGDPQDPAVVATDVTVTLAWADLLDRKIRLVTASAADLMVRPSRWPASSTPPPDDYRFLDPWLPQSLHLETGQYVSDAGDSYPLSKLLWQRQTDGSATANWSEARTAGELTVGAKLKSLTDLLQLAPVELELTVAVVGKPDSPIALKATVQPGTTSAYSMQIDLQAAEMSAQVNATGQVAWSLPDQSATTIPLLDTKQLLDIFDSYRASGADDELARELAATLPHVQLPTHRGHVAIDVIRMEDEVGKDTAFDFSSGEHGLQISALTSSGPTGILTGELGVISDEQGWTVNVDATMQAREGESDIAPQFGGSDWLWRTGRAKLAGQGDTWGTLLNSLQGDVALAGNYSGENQIPVAIEARLDNRPGEFALDSLAIKLGELQVSGSAVLSGTDRRKLTMNLKGAHMDLGFLFSTQDTKPLPGIALPDYLAAMPDLELNLTLNTENLQAPGLSLGQASATLQRTAQGGTLVATARGTNFGSLDLSLEASTPPDKPTDLRLTTNFTDMDIPEIFRQKGLVNSRSSGSLTFHSQGHGIKNIFSAMQGTAKLAMEVRSDNNWRRAASAQEKLSLTGNSSLILDSDRIVGVKIENLDIDSIDQDLNGSLVLVSDRSPWLVANLKSEMLNVTGLLALLPESTAQADQAGLVPSLTRLGAANISLDVKSLRVNDVAVANAQIGLASAPNLMTVKRFDFVSADVTVKSQGKITWQGQRAALESTAQLTDLDLDKFLINYGDVEHVPVSGSAQISSQGSRIEELIRNVTGQIDLSADAQTQRNSPLRRRQLTLKATRLADGVQADISSLQWGESDLSGSVSYHNTTPPSVEVKVQGGNLSLMPWENAHLNAKTLTEARPSESALDTIARTSANLVGDILLSPLRFLGRDDAAPPSARVFGTEPFSLDALKNFNMTLTGQLNSLVSTEITARELAFTSSLSNGQLAVQMSSGQLSGGRGEMSLALDSNAVPPSFKLTSTFQNVHGFKTRATFPRSGFISLESRGQSQAELAANANGLIFLDLGQGPFDYANSALLTANLVTTMFQTLIPGIDRQQHQLECGTSLALFQNGMGSTPYGFAARTNQANLVGHIQVDLAKETLEMNIDSRGRQGLGISVGTIFSNTVQIRGPLNNPRMVPNPTGIAWRAWAAVSTGGLSILGETLLRRIWASENPCTSVKRIIVEQLCPTNPVAASSAMVCPKT